MRHSYHTPLLGAFILGFFSVISQEIGWEERLRNDLCCVESLEWDVKLTQSIIFGFKLHGIRFSVDCWLAAAIYLSPYKHVIFRSTHRQSQPIKVGLKCPSVRSQKVSSISVKCGMYVEVDE